MNFPHIILSSASLKMIVIKKQTFARDFKGRPIGHLNLCTILKVYNKKKKFFYINYIISFAFMDVVIHIFIEFKYGVNNDK